MKTISGKVSSTTPITLSDAAKSLSKFATSDHGASHAVSYYIQRAADSFNKLVQFHENLRPNSVKQEHFVDDVKVETTSENYKKIRGVGGKVEGVVKQEDIANVYRENKKNKNFDKDEETTDADLSKKIKNSSKIDKVKREKLVKNDERFNIGNNDTSVKVETGVEDVMENGMTSRDKKKKKQKNKGVGENEGDGQTLIKTERIDIGEGEVETSKGFGKIDRSVKMETGVMEVKEDGMVDSDKKKKKKNKNRGIGENDGEDHTLIKTEQRFDIGEGEKAKSKKNELESGKSDSFVERENELQEDGMISSDKKKMKQKKNKDVGDGEVGKVEGDLMVKEEEQRKKRKSVEGDAGSAEQSNKKKSKKRRTEGEK